MERERFVIIGGVAAGMSAASRIRRLNPGAEILVFERSGYVSYIACGMPYLISKLVDSSDKLIVYGARFFEEKRNIRVFLHHEVRKINPQGKTVLVKNLETGEEQEHRYDKLLVSTGGRATRLPIKGSELEGVFTLRRLEDGLAIQDYIKNNRPKKAVVLGGGSIGMEMAEAFTANGITTTVVEKMPNILGTMDDEINELAEKELERNGVTLIKGKGVEEFTGSNSRVEKATVEGGERVEAGIALIAAGVRPNSELAREAGIELGETRAIKVNERMETNIADIYAAGDCVEAYHLVLRRNVYIPMGSTANKQGRVAGENMAGGDATFPGVAGTSLFKIFDLEVGRTGITEREALKEGLDLAANTIDHTSRSHYFPGSETIRVKLVAEKRTGRLLGGQTAGKDLAAKRVDVLVTALTAGMTVQEIKKLDLGYAPPFAPTFDPILIAANEIEKKV